MDALQAVSAAMQVVSSMVGAVSALEQASRDLDEAPKRIQSLEEFVSKLDNLTRQIKQKHVHKLHNPRLENQIQSLNALVERLHANVTKARRVLSKNKFKNFAKVVWNSMAGDPLKKLTYSIKDDLNWWLESQMLAQHLEKVIESSTQDSPVQLKVKSEKGYPISSKCKFIRRLLEQESCERVILIVGLSGIGKSCLARQVASDPPKRFVSGAVEIGFGQWCSQAACNGSKAEYQKRLAKKISKFLVQIGSWQKSSDENSGDLEYVCRLLQEALYGKSILILLDDVWEQDIVHRFAKLYDNDCRYIVTTRDESVFGITEAEKVELSKDDMWEISKSILLYHTLLSEEELPCIAENLLERCGHHPLTVAVMGKALKKETRAEKWEKAITNLSTFATCVEGPWSYVYEKGADANEKDTENKLTIFGSFEFSLEAMPVDSRRLFVALAALSWAESVPEACVEAIWSVLGQECLFPLIVCKLVEGSLLIKTEMDPLYQVHDMVSLYLDSKTTDSVEMLLNGSTLEETAFIYPWLLIFGKEKIKKLVEERIELFLCGLEERQVIITLNSIIQALMASKSISEFEASRASFSRILGPRIADIISTNSKDLIAVSAEAITNIFGKTDYCNYFQSLETAGAVVKLANILESSEDPQTQTNIFTVLAKVAEFGSPEIADQVLLSIPFHQMSDLLSSDVKEWQESMFTVLMSLINAGKCKAVERMLAFDIDKNLLNLIEDGSEVVQHHAIVTLKALYELAPNGSLRPSNLSCLPWQVRLCLERFVLSDRSISISPKPQTFEDIIHKVLDSNNQQVLEGMQDLIPIIEKAGDPSFRKMIIESPLIQRLSEFLQWGQPEQNSVRCESAFLLMKLACSGGEPFIVKFLEYEIVPQLVTMMHCHTAELQDSAYTALHQMVFCHGGVLILNKIFKTGLIGRIIQSLESKSVKTREVNVLFILDIVELGKKAWLERMLSLQVVEKLLKLEKGSGGSGESVVGFVKGIEKCKHLSMAERRVMKQQVVRKVRTSLKGHKSETQILKALDACSSGSSKGASSSGSGRRRK